MTKEQFIEEAKKYNYTDKQIRGFIKLAEKSKKMGMEIPYDKIILLDEYFD